VPGGETGFTAEKVSIETPQLFSAAELKEALKGLADLYSVVETSVQENIIGDELRGLAGSM
jgi:2-C-methyl-D-erythritol 4-phosphate cytidylyltransferase